VSQPAIRILRALRASAVDRLDWSFALSDAIHVRLKRLPGNTDVPLPACSVMHAAGFDVSAAVTEPVVLQPGDIGLIPCGFAMAVPPGYEAQIRPRSGLSSKYGVTLVNAPGTIDADYRGEVRVPLINLGRQPFTIERRMRIAQMLILPVPRAEMIEVDELDETARGQGGFGHTGR
jgi:dUTP pyrophosphatase